MTETGTETGTGAEGKHSTAAAAGGRGGPAIRRVLVVLDASTDTYEALEAATTLAARLEAEVMGLFIEDVNLLRLAALPFAREIGLGSHSRRLAPEEMERRLRARARAARTRLAAQARQARIQWSFEVRRGEWRETLETSTLEADLLVLGEFTGAVVPPAGPRTGHVLSHCLGRCRCTLFAGRRLHRLQSPMVLMADDTAAAWHALELALRLQGAEGRADGRPLPVLLPAGHPELEEAVRRLLQARGLHARFHRLQDLRPATITRAAEAAGGDILIAGAAQTLAERRELEDLLEDIHCSLMLVSEDT